jgi:hypothetical protein
MAFGLDPATLRGSNLKPSFLDDNAHMGIQDKKLAALQSKADISKGEYERCLARLNLTIDLFDSSYRPILDAV